MIENSKPKILLAEDDPINLKLMSRLLTKNGFEFLTANNGESVYESAVSNPDIDVILMDIQMPLLNGYEATEKIREWENANNNLKRFKIIALTAHSFEEEKRKCLNAGMNDFITKPINMPDLIEKIYSDYSDNKPSEENQTADFSTDLDSDK
ncbi:MAG TPA: response regulator [Ignavibacteria bacterium]|nr:response regulator [Ignavibacteria bacterium]